MGGDCGGGRECCGNVVVVVCGHLQLQVFCRRCHCLWAPAAAGVVGIAVVVIGGDDGWQLSTVVVVRGGDGGER